MSTEVQTQLIKILKTVFPVEADIRRIGKSRQHHLHKGNCWLCSKEKKLFYFELTLLGALCIAAFCVFALASSLVTKGGAFLAVWRVLHVITQHITRSVE